MDKKVRWGVLGGTSWIARDAIMPGIRKSRNGRLVATASRDPQAARRQYGDEPGVRIMSYELCSLTPRSMRSTSRCRTRCMPSGP